MKCYRESAILISLPVENECVVVRLSSTVSNVVGSLVIPFERMTSGGMAR